MTWFFLGCSVVYTEPIDLGASGRETQIRVVPNGDVRILAQGSDDLESWGDVDESEVDVRNSATSYVVCPTSRYARLRIEALTPQAPCTVEASLEGLRVTDEDQPRPSRPV